jgi:DNA-directed RNA polymerase III subunit RPC5
MPLQVVKSSDISSSDAAGVSPVTSLSSSVARRGNSLLVDRQALYDENDEVLHEIDVVLSPDLMDQLHVLQYPLAQSNIHHSRATATAASFSSLHDTLSTPVDARVKPMHGKLEIEIPLPANMEREGSYTFLGDRRLFRSRTIPIQTHLCIGRLVVPPAGEGDGGGGGAQLHLLPISGIKQMKPSFHHVDVEDQQEMDLASEMDLHDTDGDEGVAIEKKPVLFQRKESERAIMARKNSYAYQKASEDSESWIPLDVCLPQSPEYNQVMGRAVCEPRNRQVLSDATAQSTYIQSLQYHAEGGLTGFKPPTASSPALDMKALTKQVTGLMLEGVPIPFVVLRASFDPTLVPDHHLLQALSVCAVLVRGNFVLNSQLLLSASPPGVARCRTLILLVLQKFGRVSRPRLHQAINSAARSDDELPLSSDRLMFLLEQVAKRTKEGWELKLPDDTLFLEQFPEQVALFDRYWSRQATRFEKELSRYGGA